MSTAALKAKLESVLGSSVFLFREKPAPQTISTGIGEIDSECGGLPRGAITEIVGAASSGRTTLLYSILAEAMARGEACALVDASDAFDPVSAAAAGVDFQQLLWIRCTREQGTGIREQNQSCARPIRAREQAGALRNRAQEKKALQIAIRVTDLLVQSGCHPSTSHSNSPKPRAGDPGECATTPTGAAPAPPQRMQRSLGGPPVGGPGAGGPGWGVIAMDLGDMEPKEARRIPLNTWYRFRLAVENKSTAFVLIGQEPCAGSCSALILETNKVKCRWKGLLLRGAVFQTDRRKPVPPTAAAAVGVVAHSPGSPARGLGELGWKLLGRTACFKALALG